MIINTLLLENLSKCESTFIYDDENREYKVSVFDVSEKTIEEYALEEGEDFCAQDFDKAFEVYLVGKNGIRVDYAAFNFSNELIINPLSIDFDWLTLSGIKEGSHGTVEYEGELYILEEEAYASNYGTDEGVAYYTHATKVGEPLEDVFGELERKKYLVTWLTTSEYDAACAIYPKQDELDRLINKQARGERLHEDEKDDLASLPKTINDLREEYGFAEDDILLDPTDESNACHWDKPYSVKLI